MLRRYFRFLVPDHQTLERIINKRLQYESAAAAGIPIPRTHFPDSIEQARDIAAKMSYPLHPQTLPLTCQPEKAGQEKGVVASSIAELTDAYVHISALDVPLMIQEIIPGGDNGLLGYLGFWDSEGVERAWLTKRKLRQHPPGFGDGSFR